jgi:hypothetical protein
MNIPLEIKVVEKYIDHSRKRRRTGVFSRKM